jgi:hypothetical protein
MHTSPEGSPSTQLPSPSSSSTIIPRHGSSGSGPHLSPSGPRRSPSNPHSSPPSYFSLPPSSPPAADVPPASSPPPVVQNHPPHARPPPPAYGAPVPTTFDLTETSPPPYNNARDLPSAPASIPAPPAPLPAPPPQVQVIDLTHVPDTPLRTFVDLCSSVSPTPEAELLPEIPLSATSHAGNRHQSTPRQVPYIEVPPLPPRGGHETGSGPVLEVRKRKVAPTTPEAGPSRGSARQATKRPCQDTSQSDSDSEWVPEVRARKDKGKRRADPKARR